MTTENVPLLVVGSKRMPGASTQTLGGQGSALPTATTAWVVPSCTAAGNNVSSTGAAA